MHILIIRNYKQKALLGAGILCLWIAVMYLCSLLKVDSGNHTLKIEGFFSFYHSASLQIGEIYRKDTLENTTIEASFITGCPETRSISSFKSPTGKFGFEYPSVFSLHQQQFPGSEILYHIDLINKNTKDIHGLVQVWNLPYSLEEFLNRSKSTSQQTYQNFKESSIVIDGIRGYLWDYSVLTSDGKTYKALEAFYKKDDRMYRISYFTPLKLWNSQQLNYFQTIINSFKTYA